MFGCIRGRPLNSLSSSVYIAQNSFFQKIIKLSKCLNQGQDLISATLNKVVASKERARIHKMLQPRQNATPLEFFLMSFKRHCLTSPCIGFYSIYKRFSFDSHIKCVLSYMIYAVISIRNSFNLNKPNT